MDALRVEMDNLKELISSVDSQLSYIRTHYNMTIPDLEASLQTIVERHHAWSKMLPEDPVLPVQSDDIGQTVHRDTVKLQEASAHLDELKNRLASQSPSHKGLGIRLITRLRGCRPVSTVLGKKT